MEISEPDVDKMVKEAAGQLSSKCGAVVEEVSIPMHSDGNRNFILFYLFIYFSYFLQSTCPKACGFSCKDRLRSNMDNIRGSKKEV